MPRAFEELDRVVTPIGEVSLRRRVDPALGVDVFEVKVGDEFLMSSLFTVAETELALMALAEAPSRPLQVVVGGLGLGYTARAALGDARAVRLDVVEMVAAVIGWHQRRLVPAAADVAGDPRCRFHQADFFALVADGHPLGDAPDVWDVVLVDIDHSPRQVLHPSHASFYQREGLLRLSSRMPTDGVFGLWSDEQPDADFLAELEAAFTKAHAHVISFPNPYTGGSSTATVYVASGPRR